MKKILTILLFSFILVFLLHNLLYFPPRGSYDPGSHYRYANTLLKQKRFPIRDESVHFHNPPLWYLIGSASIAFTENILKLTDWRLTIKPWQMTNLLFSFFSLVLWYKISRFVFKKQAYPSIFFILFLFSLPVFLRISAMMSIEPVLTFISSLLIFLLFKFTRNKLTIKHLIIFGTILGLAMITKITSYAFVVTLGLIIFITVWLKDKRDLMTSIFAGLVVAGLILALSGWFYIYKAKAYGLLTSGKIYSIRTQPKSFYTDYPIRIMLSYPVRPWIGNKFFPVMYVDFWGDYWNYFSQRRYGVDIEFLRTKNREKVSETRRLDLARQTQVNLFTTAIIVLGFIITSLRRIKSIFKNKFNHQSIQSLTLLTFFWVSFLGYFYFQSRAPSWDGSNIKPSHLIYIWPVPILFTVEYLYSIKNKFIRLSIILLLFFPIGLNLWFSWF